MPIQTTSKKLLVSITLNSFNLSSAGKCLKFWYFLDGLSASELRVKVRKMGEEKAITIWKTRDLTRGDWREAQALYTFTDNHTVRPCLPVLVPAGAAASLSRCTATPLLTHPLLCQSRNDFTTLSLTVIFSSRPSFLRSFSLESITSSLESFQELICTIPYSFFIIVNCFRQDGMKLSKTK